MLQSPSFPFPKPQWGFPSSACVLHMGRPGFRDAKRWLQFQLLYGIRTHTYWALRSKPGPVLCTLHVLISRILTLIPWGSLLSHFFKDERAKTLRGQVTFPRLHSQQAVVLGFERRNPGSRLCSCLFRRVLSVLCSSVVPLASGPPRWAHIVMREMHTKQKPTHTTPRLFADDCGEKY